MTNLLLKHRLRNKLRISATTAVDIHPSARLKGVHIIVRGNCNKLHIGAGSLVTNTRLEIIGNHCSIFIGKDCMIGDSCYLSAREEGTHLVIGDKSGLSRNVKVMTSDGHSIMQDERRINQAGDIYIGEQVWLADSVTILKGVTVGEGSVIGIHSLVTKSVPPHAIAVGNPARVVKSAIDWRTELL